MLMIALGLVDVAAADVLAVVAAAVGLVASVGAAVGAVVGAVVGAALDAVVGFGGAAVAADAPLVGGAVGATAVGVLHAVSSGRPTPRTARRWRSARRAMCTAPILPA